MPQLLLFIYLHEDETNTVETLMSYIEKQERKPLFQHDGVVRLAQNTFAFDKTMAHGLLVRLCAVAQRRGRAYLLVPVDATFSLLAGTPPKDIQDILLKFEVPFCPTLSSTSP